MSRAISIVAVWTAFLLSLAAAPIDRLPITVTQPDGKTLTLYVSGDEFHNRIHDAEGYTVVKHPETGYYVYADKNAAGEIVPTKAVVGERSARSAGVEKGVNLSPEAIRAKRDAFFAQTPDDVGDAPRFGSFNNIVIFIRFSDETEFGESIDGYEQMFNASSSGANSMLRYFQEASYGNLTISSTFYPLPSNGMVVSYQDSQPRSYFEPYSSANPGGYRANERGDREFALLKRAVDGVADQIPPSLDVDADNDGDVDNVVFVVSGSPTGWSDLLWPHRWALFGASATINGARVYDFNFQLQSSLASSAVGVLCHEMFHSLGAPDLYHYTSNGITPVGPWDIMQHNYNPPQHMSAYMKYQYGGWIESIPEITDSGVYTLNPLTSETNNCYKIRSTRANDEYFVLEYRRDQGVFEGSLPGSGLLVYRVDRKREGMGNAGGPPDELYVYRPGGGPTSNGSIYEANLSAEEGRTKLDHTTDPIPFLSDGAYGGLNIGDVSSAGETISFRFNLVNSILAMNPSGGEYWRVGSKKTIDWDPFGDVTTVRIDYSTDGGETWTEIADGLNAASGAYEWTLPNTPTFRAVVRVSDADDPSVFDQNEDVFAILPSGSYRMTERSRLAVSGSANDVVAEGAFAYLAAGASGVVSISIADPDAIETLDEIDTPGSAGALFLDDTLLYVADGAGGLRILSVADPEAISEIGAFTNVADAKDVAVAEDRAILADYDAGVLVLDVSDPTAPSEVGFVPIDGFSRRVAVGGGYAYVAAENNGVRIVDYRAFGETSHLETVGWANDLEYRDGYLFLADGDAGFSVVNVADPLLPYFAGNCRLEGAAYAVDVEDDFALVASQQYGLFAVDVSDTARPTPVGFFDTPGFVVGVGATDSVALTAEMIGMTIALENDEWIVGVADRRYPETTPNDFRLAQNYPNPFNPVTTIEYALPERARVTLEVYDALGAKVATLFDGERAAGTYHARFDATNLSSGVYVALLRSEATTRSIKMLLLK